MGLGQHLSRTTAADLGLILATCALLSTCAPHSSIGSVDAGSRDAQGCPDRLTTDDRRTGPRDAIDRPEKIGIGTWDSFGLPRMLRDVDLIGAGWFYNWRSALPELSVEGWSLGEDVSLGGTPGDLHVALGSRRADAWFSQTTLVRGGRSYDLFLSASGPASAGGGLTVKFVDSSDTLLKEEWMPLSGATGAALLPDIVAPPGSVAAKIVGWQSAGRDLALDDIMLVGDGVDVVQNGDFETSRRVVGMPQDFVPMIWGRADVTPDKLGDIARAGVALGFNEPDIAQQSDVTVREALELWPRLMATGARLGSPATTSGASLGAGSWLARFMKEAEARGLRVDFVAVHYYSADPDVAVFKSFLEDVHAAYARPVWVTEWGLVDWDDHGRFSSEETAAFLREGALMMDDLDFVERHAWFGAYDGLGGFRINTHLLETVAGLTPVGEVFAELAHGCARLASSAARGAHWALRPHVSPDNFLRRRMAVSL